MRRRAFLLSGLALPFAGRSAAARQPLWRISLAPLPAGTIVDRILVEKRRRRLTLYSTGHALKAYAIALGFGEPGAKRREGDGRTPVGHYMIDGRNPNSAFHLSLHISYPEPADVARAAAHGWSPGGAIMIHGLPNGLGALGAMHRRRDWTAGCIAVTNAEIEEIWRAVPDGTPIDIVP